MDNDYKHWKSEEALVKYILNAIGLVDFQCRLDIEDIQKVHFYNPPRYLDEIVAPPRRLTLDAFHKYLGDDFPIRLEFRHLTTREESTLTTMQMKTRLDKSLIWREFEKFIGHSEIKWRGALIIRFPRIRNIGEALVAHNVQSLADSHPESWRRFECDGCQMILGTLDTLLSQYHECLPPK